VLWHQGEDLERELNGQTIVLEVEESSDLLGVGEAGRSKDDLEVVHIALRINLPTLTVSHHSVISGYEHQPYPCAMFSLDCSAFAQAVPSVYLPCFSLTSLLKCHLFWKVSLAFTLAWFRDPDVCFCATNLSPAPHFASLSPNSSTCEENVPYSFTTTVARYWLSGLWVREPSLHEREKIVPHCIYRALAVRVPQASHS
jgi:hypothetical protein